MAPPTYHTTLARATSYRCEAARRRQLSSGPLARRRKHMIKYDTIHNMPLLQNGLDHILFELGRENVSYFRVARESHLVLYRSMIECLKGTANIAVTMKPARQREHFYQIGSDPIKKIQKEDIPRCTKAWRFSEPTVVKAFPKNKGRISEPLNDFLIPFYDALAMIQTELFTQLNAQKPLLVSNGDMKTLEWLHEWIRNEYEHFVPKHYSAPVKSLLAAAKLALDIAHFCIFEPDDIIWYAVNKEEISNAFKTSLTLISNHEAAAG